MSQNLPTFVLVVMQILEGMTKTEIQEKALRAWEDAGRVGGVFLPPGTGKTRLGVMAYESCGKPTTLVVTSRVPLVEQWKEEGIDADVLCINTACKIQREVDLLIVDEVHRSLSPVFRKLYENVKYKYLLTLSGTRPEKEEYEEFLERVSPTVYTEELQDLVEAGGILAPVKIYNVPCKFDKYNQAKYRAFDGKFIEATIALSGMIRSRYNSFASAFELARAAKDSQGFDEYTKRMAKQFWSAMTMRKFSVYNNTEKIKFAKEVIERFPSRKWIIFTKTISMAEEVAKTVGGLLYHSKLSSAERQKILDDFSSSSKHLIAVDALNEGLNVPSADSALVLSGVSTVLTNIQQIGRVSRMVEGKEALIINAVTENTVEQRWVTNKNKKLMSVWTTLDSIS
ncbi:hypothetical protein EKK58_08920 [Candidatus Dependentiae bacterium]|nr:MAG: hypothetical protein EKK58_08920 [Candidatus Dependentiae bacterium]